MLKVNNIGIFYINRKEKTYIIFDWNQITFKLNILNNNCNC